jgi:hypothetical protein
LEAERLLYRSLASLVQNNFTPNLVRYVGDWLCTLRDMQKSTKPALWQRFAKQVDAVYGKYKVRPSSSDPVRFLLTERGGISLSDWLRKERPTEADLIAVLFQVIYTLAVMNAFGIRQGDLHTGNVLVERGPKDARSAYYIPEPQSEQPVQAFKVPFKWVPKIFDWDWGGIYAKPARPSFPKMPIILNETAQRQCSTMSTCGPNPKADVYTLLSSLYSELRPYRRRYPSVLAFLRRNINPELLSFGPYFTDAGGFQFRLCRGPLATQCARNPRAQGQVQQTGRECESAWLPPDCVMHTPLEMLSDPVFAPYAVESVDNATPVYGIWPNRNVQARYLS